MNERFLLIGNGYIASFFRKKLPLANQPLGKIFSPQDVVSALDSFQPTHVINCAGTTGRPNVDWCESHPGETYFGNVTLPLLLATETTKRGIHLTHIGSGCIYEGTNQGSGFNETDAPNFRGSLYSRTKAIAEQALSDFPVLQTRLRMPLDASPHQRNLLTKLLSYVHNGNPIVSSLNSISYVPDFIDATLALIRNSKTGIYNIVNPGPLTHQTLLEAYFVDHSSPVPPMRFVSPTELDTVTAARRSNCVLSTHKLDMEIGPLPSLEKRLPTIIRTYRSEERKP
jgi:dTDP-4-dehydrorhamnose reductase